MTNFASKIKWVVIYVVGTIVGLFAGANLLGANVGLYLCERFQHGPCVELDALGALVYAGLVGAGIAIVLITLIKVILSKKPANIR